VLQCPWARRKTRVVSGASRRARWRDLPGRGGLHRSYGAAGVHGGVGCFGWWWLCDTSPTYPSFLMLHACFYTICLVFRYTSWHFYAFSGTNLLTRCHSASFLFSSVFVFQKSYIGNILGIGRNKSQTSRYLPKLPENRRGDGKEP
jgi:hypothetical protein